MTPLAPRRREAPAGADRRRWYLGSADGERMRSVGRAVVPARERGTTGEDPAGQPRGPGIEARPYTICRIAAGMSSAPYTASHHVAPAFSSSTASVAAWRWSSGRRRPAGHGSVVAEVRAPISIHTAPSYPASTCSARSASWEVASKNQASASGVGEGLGGWPNSLSHFSGRWCRRPGATRSVAEGRAGPRRRGA